MFDTTTHYGTQSTPSTSVGCSPTRQAEDPIMYPPPLPLLDQISAHRLAVTIRDMREVGVVQGAELAHNLANQLYPTDPRRALQFVNLADPIAHNAAVRP